MARYRFQQRTAAIALLIIALASCGLTACGSSSNPAGQARSLSPQEAAILEKRHAAAIELISCARRHGIRLPPPTAAGVNVSGVNVSGVKGRRRAVAISNCYQKGLRKARREARAERAAQAEQEARPPNPGEASPSG